MDCKDTSRRNVAPSHTEGIDASGGKVAGAVSVLIFHTCDFLLIYFFVFMYIYIYIFIYMYHPPHGMVPKPAFCSIPHEKAGFAVFFARWVAGAVRRPANS